MFSIQNHLSGTFGRGKLKRMQSTPIIISKPEHKDNIAAINLSPILSTETSSVTIHSGLNALSTLYADKIGNFTAKTEINEFSHWLGPKIASTVTNIKNPLDGTYIEKAPAQSETITEPLNKENAINTKFETIVPLNPGQLSVLSDILNKQNGSTPRSPDKISITVNKQSSVWLNSSRDYAKESVVETENNDMEELHTELDKILDQLQKLVT